MRKTMISLAKLLVLLLLVVVVVFIDENRGVRIKF